MYYGICHVYAPSNHGGVFAGIYGILPYKERTLALNLTLFEVTASPTVRKYVRC